MVYVDEIEGHDKLYSAKAWLTELFINSQASADGFSSFWVVIVSNGLAATYFLA